MKKRGIILILSIIVAIILGIVSLYTPKAKVDKSSFSTEMAKEHIKEISKEIHSVNNKEELKRVREYILGELKELGLEPQVFSYENVENKKGEKYDINNIYAKLDGKNGEAGSYILLATHYDSSPKKRSGEDGESKGAADAGYGISTILETLRVIKESGQSLENGIKILITDGEEVGLLGAREEMANNFELYKNVSYVVNLEARGIKGPALMFETSANNRKVIDLYSEANLPVTYSLASDIYNRMPNGSDFTEFKNAGLQGVNFAVLNDLDYYHTKNDNYENISDTTIQHYGEQVLPIVKEFVYNEKYGDVNYFNADGNSVFFTLLPNVLIKYPISVATVLAIIIIIVLAIITKIKNTKIALVTKWTSFWIALAIGVVALGVVISRMVSMATGVEFNLTYMPRVAGADLIALISVAITSLLVGLIVKKMAKRNEDIVGMILGGLWFNAILLVLFMIVLPGGSYLFLWPMVVNCVAMAMIKNNSKNKGILILPIMLTILMYVPVVYNIYIALTIGALGIVLLLTLISLAIIAPAIGYLAQGEEITYSKSLLKRTA